MLGDLGTTLIVLAVTHVATLVAPPWRHPPMQTSDDRCEVVGEWRVKSWAAL
jgi:hypothetical protein